MVRTTGERRSRRLRRVLASGALALAGAIGLVACGGSGSGGANASSPGSLASILGDGHVHSLIVDRKDPKRLWLGLHAGLYVSANAGRTWDLADLSGDDAMNLATAAKGAPLWVAGHDVLERSTDDGATWESVRPAGLPGLDLHGFAVRPDRPKEIVAAVAGQGLYGSQDSGASFQLLTRTVGPSVLGIALTADDTLFATDPAQGLLVSPDGGRTFRTAIKGPGLVSVATVPGRPRYILAAGAPGVVVSRDGGHTWESAFTGSGVAAVAIDPTIPRRAYAVGDDGRVYLTSDAARTWSSVKGKA